MTLGRQRGFCLYQLWTGFQPLLGMVIPETIWDLLSSLWLDPEHDAFPQGSLLQDNVYTWVLSNIITVES